MSAPYQLDFRRNFNNLWNECLNECGFTFDSDEISNGYRFGQFDQHSQRFKHNDKHFRNYVVDPHNYNEFEKYQETPLCLNRQFGKDSVWSEDRHFQIEKKHVHWTDDPDIWPHDYKPWEINKHKEQY